MKDNTPLPEPPMDWDDYEYCPICHGMIYNPDKEWIHRMGGHGPGCVGPQ